MSRFILILGLAFADLTAADYTVVVTDEDHRPLADAAIEAVFSRQNDPRVSSMRSFEGRSDQLGVFRFAADKELCLIRLRAGKPGYFEADADRRHGLGGFPSRQNHALTLPRAAEGTPLAFKDVLLTAEKGELPAKTWVGFDFAIGEAVAPWGRGVSKDVSIWNEGGQVGWTESAETIERLRKDPFFASMDESRFADIYGSFRGVTRIRFEHKGAGIVRTSAFWAYSGLKMPPLAPPDGYAPELELPYGTLPLAAESENHTGFFLRLRPTCDPAGRVTSACYAKIHGRIESGYGWVAFRFYYNPNPDDRRLVYDRKHNLLKPPSGADLSRYQTQER